MGLNIISIDVFNKTYQKIVGEIDYLFDFASASAVSSKVGLLFMISHLISIILGGNYADGLFFRNSYHTF
jgi:hypothetical protein